MRIARVERLVAAAACALAVAGAQAVEIDTLFHTPQERARLDSLRRGEPVERIGRPAGVRRNELTGFVKRSDGRATAWIDGVPTDVSPKLAPLLDSKSVRGYADRGKSDLKVERKPAR